MPTIDESLSLNRRYRLLREQLHAAYNAVAWDSTTIDRIAGELMSVERALALGGAFEPPPFRPAGAQHPVGMATGSSTPAGVSAESHAADPESAACLRAAAH